MSNIKIELFDPSDYSINHYDDEVMKYSGLISYSLYHGKRKIRGIYTISYKYVYGDPLFIIDSSEKDLVEAIGFDTINCNCNKNDLKKETGLTFRLEILKIKKSMIFSDEYKRNIVIYSSEEIDTAFLKDYIPLKKPIRQSIKEWWSSPIWFKVLIIIVPFSLLSISLSKLLTTRALQIMGFVIALILGTPFILENLNSSLRELIGNKWGKIALCIILLNIASLMLPLFDVKKVKGSKF